MSLLMLSAAVNAALPASITLSLLYGQTRLKKLGIFCISPQRINLAGQLNLVCFDKVSIILLNGLHSINVFHALSKLKKDCRVKHHT